MASPSVVRMAVGGLIVLLIALTGCATPISAPEIEPTQTTVSTSLPANPTETIEAQPTITAIPEPTATDIPQPTVESQLPIAESEWVADGVITEGEYTYGEDFSGIRFWWKNDATHLYFAMEGDTTGWVSVGIDPERRMQGANYLFGYVDGDAVKLWDAFGTAPTGPNHPPDEELGGTVDIVTYAGIEEKGITRFEIQIPLDTGDAYDKTLVPGQTYPYIIAIGGEDSFNAYHQKYAEGQLVLD